MINIPIFSGIVVTAIISLYTVALISPTEDPFAIKSSPRAIDLGAMAQPTTAELKIRHAEKREAYQIGLFGNSRMLMVGADALETGPDQVFNFALSSESLDGSVMMIDHLAALGRLPKTIVIGLDNFNLQRDNVSIWPSFVKRLSHAINIVVAAVQNGALITALRRIWRFSWGEVIRFEMVFDPTLVYTGLTRILTSQKFEAALPGHGGYRSDGSQEAPVRTPKIVPIVPTKSRLDLAKLQRNLSRLGGLVTDGYTVILIETPLYPASQQALAAAQLNYVQDARRRWHVACATLELNCFDAPLIPDHSNAPWYDSTHPPEKPWARYISAAIKMGKR